MPAGFFAYRCGDYVYDVTVHEPKSSVWRDNTGRASNTWSGSRMACWKLWRLTFLTRTGRQSRKRKRQPMPPCGGGSAVTAKGHPSQVPATSTKTHFSELSCSGSGPTVNVTGRGLRSRGRIIPDPWLTSPARAPAIASMAAMRFSAKNTIRLRPRHLVDEQCKRSAPAASAHSITPSLVVKIVAGIGESYYRR